MKETKKNYPPNLANLLGQWPKLSQGFAIVDLINVLILIFINSLAKEKYNRQLTAS